jgi:hypothetical protein
VQADRDAASAGGTARDVGAAKADVERLTRKPQAGAAPPSPDTAPVRESRRTASPAGQTRKPAAAQRDSTERTASSTAGRKSDVERLTRELMSDAGLPYSGTSERDLGTAAADAALPVDPQAQATGASDTAAVQSSVSLPRARVPDAPARPQAAAPLAPKAPAEKLARVAPLDLPNLSATARGLRVGDSWTYRLREVILDRNLATVTHEIEGGDASGIRETLHIGGQGDTQRRLSLEPRLFEQRIGGDAMLFEFAPFLTAFSELRPGTAWPRIRGAANSDALGEWRFDGKVTGSERVRVPAGTFEATRAELEGRRDISFPTTRDVYSEIEASYQTYSIWFVPEIGRAVKYERRTYNRARRLLEHERYELVSYRLK